MKEKIRAYRVTPVFDQHTLPKALRTAHNTKQGVWGVIRVLEGVLRYVTVEPRREQILDATCPGLLHPRELHFVEPVGSMRMQVEFYDRPLDIPLANGRRRSRGEPGRRWARPARHRRAAA